MLGRLRSGRGGGEREEEEELGRGGGARALIARCRRNAPMPTSVVMRLMIWGGVSEI